MSSDFTEMLKETLSKMQERIEFANEQWKGNDASMLKRFEDTIKQWNRMLQLMVLLQIYGVKNRLVFLIIHPLSDLIAELAAKGSFSAMEDVEVTPCFFGRMLCPTRVRSLAGGALVWSSSPKCISSKSPHSFKSGFSSFPSRISSHMSLISRGTRLEVTLVDLSRVGNLFTSSNQGSWLTSSIIMS